MGAAAVAAQVFGGLFACLWLASAACVVFALWRLKQFALTSTLLHFYKRRKAVALVGLLAWCAVKLLADWWWIDPRAVPSRSIVVDVLVDGFCRTSVFAVILLYWRMPLSSFLVNRVSLRSRNSVAPLGDPRSLLDGARSHAGSASPRGHRRAESASPLRGSHAEPRIPRRASFVAVAVENTGGEADSPPAATASADAATRSRAQEQQRGKSPMPRALQGDAGSAPLPAQQVDQRLSAAVTSKSWAVVPIAVVVIGVILHIAFAIVQSRATASAGGLRWCVVSESTGLNMCVVPIEGSSREEILLLARRELEEEAAEAATPEGTGVSTIATVSPSDRSTSAGQDSSTFGNSTWAPVTTTPAPTDSLLERVVVNSGFDATPVLVVQARIVTIVNFMAKAMIALLWLVVSREYASGIINRRSAELFRVFRVVSTAMCCLTTAAECTMLFDQVRSTGWAFTMSLLIGNGADAILVAMIALRAAKIKELTEVCPCLRRDVHAAPQEPAPRVLGPIGRLTHRR